MVRILQLKRTLFTLQSQQRKSARLFENCKISVDQDVKETHNTEPSPQNRQ